MALVFGDRDGEGILGAVMAVVFRGRVWLVFEGRLFVGVVVVWCSGGGGAGCG